MKFTIATVGRPRDRAIAQAIDDYEQRAARYWPIESVEVRAGGGIEREGVRLADAVGDSRIIICEPGGTSRTSEEFARWLQDLRERAAHVAFVIGGAFGIDKALTSRASSRLSLAPWTLPHEMARLVLAEQMYRAGTILKGEPYHK